MKIVLDTTILVRANEHSHGLARELLATVVDRKHTLLISNEMLHELARVLRYPRLQAFYDLPETLVYKLHRFPTPFLGSCDFESTRDSANPRCKRYQRDADRDHRRGRHSVHEG